MTGFLFSLVSKGVAPVSHLSEAPLRSIDSSHHPAFLSLFRMFHYCPNDLSRTSSAGSVAEALNEIFSFLD
jgi:hypothetical protein